MQKTIIVPLSKSPHPAGRVGSVRSQDWFQGLVRAVSIARLESSAEILVLSNFQARGQPHEADLYENALSELDAKNVRIVRECNETIGQVDRCFELAVAEGKDLLLISTFLHYLRVQWIVWRHPSRKKVRVRHVPAFGIPRPREALTDLLFTVTYPLVDVLGLRRRLLVWVNRRREGGKH